MKVWILFLLTSFVIGIALRDRSTAVRNAVALGLAVVVTLALYSRRWA
jgi:hypothetical protein